MTEQTLTPGMLTNIQATMVLGLLLDKFGYDVIRDSDDRISLRRRDGKRFKRPDYVTFPHPSAAFGVGTVVKFSDVESTLKGLGYRLVQE